MSEEEGLRNYDQHKAVLDTHASEWSHNYEWNTRSSH